MAFRVERQRAERAWWAPGSNDRLSARHECPSGASGDAHRQDVTAQLFVIIFGRLGRRFDEHSLGIAVPCDPQNRHTKVLFDWRVQGFGCRCRWGRAPPGLPGQSTPRRSNRSSMPSSARRACGPVPSLLLRSSCAFRREPEGRRRAAREVRQFPATNRSGSMNEWSVMRFSVCCATAGMQGRPLHRRRRRRTSADLRRLLLGMREDTSPPLSLIRSTNGRVAARNARHSVMPGRR